MIEDETAFEWLDRLLQDFVKVALAGIACLVIAAIAIASLISR